MGKCKIKIACLEPLDILYEGVTNILMKTGHHYFFSRVGDLDELRVLLEREVFQVVVANPAALLNRSGDVMKLKRDFPFMPWVGLSYTFVDTSVMNLFDGIISLSDSRAEVSKKMDRFANRCNCDDVVKEELSAREKDVLKHLVNGESNKEISDKLNISIHTVISHRKNIVRKTGVKSLSGLAIYAITSKIVSL
jgi:DNA-binding CsgD family transcriptional regulator